MRSLTLLFTAILACNGSSPSSSSTIDDDRGHGDTTPTVPLGDHHVATLTIDGAVVATALVDAVGVTTHYPEEGVSCTPSATVSIGPGPYFLPQTFVLALAVFEPLDELPAQWVAPFIEVYHEQAIGYSENGVYPWHSILTTDLRITQLDAAGFRMESSGGERCEEFAFASGEDRGHCTPYTSLVFEAVDQTGPVPPAYTCLGITSVPDFMPPLCLYGSQERIDCP